MRQVLQRWWGLVKGVWGGTGAAVAPTLQTTCRVLLGFVLLFICVAAVRMGKLLARTLSLCASARRG